MDASENDSKTFSKLINKQRTNAYKDTGSLIVIGKNECFYRLVLSLLVCCNQGWFLFQHDAAWCLFLFNVDVEADNY
jgi:hypothetical protein